MGDNPYESCCNEELLTDQPHQSVWLDCLCLCHVFESIITCFAGLTENNPASRPPTPQTPSNTHTHTHTPTHPKCLLILHLQGLPKNPSGACLGLEWLTWCPKETGHNNPAINAIYTRQPWLRYHLHWTTLAPIPSTLDNPGSDAIYTGPPWLRYHLHWTTLAPILSTLDNPGSDAIYTGLPWLRCNI